MVSNKDIKALDFETIQDYYGYILNSEVNGQRSQVFELINALSRAQKKGFLLYLLDIDNIFGNDKETIRTLLIASM